MKKNLSLNRFFYCAMAQHFKNFLLKLRQFIQKQNTVMCHDHFAGSWDISATDKTCIGYDMMGRLEYFYGNQRLGF
jgi:hypothetical protein